VKNISRFCYWVSGAGIFGAGVLWLISAFSGFSTSRVVCFSTGQPCLDTNNPSWTANKVFWLAPLVIIMIICAWLFSMTILPDRTPEVISALVILLLLFGIAQFAIHFALLRGQG